MEKRESLNFEGVNVDYPAYMNNLKLAGILMDLAEKVRNSPQASMNPTLEEQSRTNDEQIPNEHTDLSAAPIVGSQR